MAPSGQGLFSLYICTENMSCIENFNNLTNHCPDFKINLQNYPEVAINALWVKIIQEGQDGPISLT